MCTVEGWKGAVEGTKQQGVEEKREAQEGRKRWVKGWRQRGLRGEVQVGE